MRRKKYKKRFFIFTFKILENGPLEVTFIVSNQERNQQLCNILNIMFHIIDTNDVEWAIFGSVLGVKYL